MSNTITLHDLVTSPWTTLVLAIVVLVFVIGAKTFFADVSSALTNWVAGKIAAVTGIRPDVSSGLANGIKSVPGVIRGNKFFVFLAVNAIIAVLIGVMVARSEHSLPSVPQVSQSPSFTHS